MSYMQQLLFTISIMEKKITEAMSRLCYPFFHVISPISYKWSRQKTAKIYTIIQRQGKKKLLLKNYCMDSDKMKYYRVNWRKAQYCLCYRMHDTNKKHWIFRNISRKKKLYTRKLALLSVGYILKLHLTIKGRNGWTVKRKINCNELKGKKKV